LSMKEVCGKRRLRGNRKQSSRRRRN